MGIFITIEGPNGVGKSTFIEKLSERLGKEYPIILTKEPTDTDIGKYVRNNEGDLKGNAYAYLIAADRANHLENYIEPELEKNKVVICDRYIESSVVLQSFDGVSIEDIWRINSKFKIPDISIILLAREDTILARLSEREKLTYFEKKMTRADEIKGYLFANEFLKSRDFNTMILYNESKEELEMNIEKVIKEIACIKENGENGK